MGKGTIGINPFFADRNVLSPSAVAGLLSLLVSFTDAKSCTCYLEGRPLRSADPCLPTVVLDKSHWMLYWIVTAMYPQFLITLNEQLEEQPVTVRVGQAVNTVGLAGQRMGISGVSVDYVPVSITMLTIPSTSSKPIKPRCAWLWANERNSEQTNGSRTASWRVS